jgi:hypothetical protein
MGPKGTPKDIIARLNDAVVNTLAEPSIRQKSPTRAWRFRRARRRRPRRWKPFTGPRSKGGGIKAADIKGE